MLRLLLARHGQTDWNAQHRYQGHAPVPLNKTGREQAVALGRRLAREDIEAIHSSDLPRAWQTAQIVSKDCGLPVIAEPLLREMDFGEWQGRTHAEIHADRAQQSTSATPAQARYQEPLSFAPDGGETLRQLAGRISSALETARRTQQDKTILWVTHGGPLRALFCLVLGLSLEKNGLFRTNTASVSELHVYPDRTLLALLNDTHHLG
jgi:alpha-ribazole phosphatase/probable phosphoglycerate mutase